MTGSENMRPPPGDLLLQMDIEGAEWPVLLNVSDETLRRFRIIVIELHDLERILDRHALRIMQATASRLAEHFRVVHSHPNNHGGVVRKGRRPIPRVIEITLLRRDRCRALGQATLPHHLDRANAPEKADVRLPLTWTVA